MVAGVTAFVSFDKTVQLTVDGKTSKVHTFASSVSGVLARQGITIGAHDSVVPSRAPASARASASRSASVGPSTSTST